MERCSEAEPWNGAASPGEQKVYQIRRSDVFPSFWKCNRLPFREIIQIGVEDFFNGLVCISVRTGGVQLRNVKNLPCAAFKIDFNFTPLAVVVCLVFVDCSGDFLFSADDLLLLYGHGANGVILHHQLR